VCQSHFFDLSQRPEERQQYLPKPTGRHLNKMSCHPIVQPIAFEVSFNFNLQFNLFSLFLIKPGKRDREHKIIDVDLKM